MDTLELKFLGDFAVSRNGEPQVLPPSKKTRALLAYLSLQHRHFRREHLCELLWEVPDDPRASLRWSLSKLRRLLDEDGHKRIIADRTQVTVNTSDVAIDISQLHALVKNGLEQAPVAALEDAAERNHGHFLEGLEFSNFHDFHAWCIAEREQSARAQASLLRELVRRHTDEPPRALPYARALVGITPYDETARATLIRLLVAMQYADEAEQQHQLGLRMLREVGAISSGAMARALRSGSAARTQVADTSGNLRQQTAPARDTPGNALVGRETELAQLAAALATVTDTGTARVLVLFGEPGIGKSRLLRSMLQLAGDARAFRLHSRAFESEAIRPFGLWIDALRTLPDPAAADVFDDNESTNRERLFSALNDLVARHCEQQSVVLVFDDVHWCDESSVAALHYVMRTNRRRPVLAVLAARDVEVRDNEPLQQAFRGLRHDGLLHELKVGRLPVAAVQQIIAARAPGADARRLSRESRGNPLLAIELARAGDDGASGSFDKLVLGRLARFDVNGAEVLRWAALLNHGIDVPQLVTLSGQDAVTVGATLENAEQQAILASTDRGLRFSHDLMARAIYKDISPVRRRVMHRRVAEILARDATLTIARAADLAHHATQSGDAGMAARAMVSAGRQCLRYFANDEALSLARKGLALADKLPDAERVTVSVDLHEVILLAAPLDDWEEAARVYVDLAEQALDHGARAHARLGYHMASYLRWQHDQWSGAREQSLQSERAVRGGSDDDHIIGMAETARCLAMLERDLPRADAMLMEAEALASRRRFTHWAIPGGLGMLRLYENKLDDAEEHFQQARALCKSAGERIDEFQANEYLAMLEWQRGRYEAAQAHCDELLSLGGKLREGSEAPFARALHGLCGYALLDQSGPMDAALAELRIVDAKHRLAYVLTRAALLDQERGRCDVGARRAREALDYATLLERATEMLLANVVLALTCQADGDTAASQQHRAEIARLRAAGVSAWAQDVVTRLISGEPDRETARIHNG